MKFIEAKLERAFTELLEQEGFSHHLDISIVRKPDEVLIEEDLQNFLLNQYASQGIKMLSDGFILKREDRKQKDIYIQLINYSRLNKHRQSNEDKVITIAVDPEAPYPPDTNIYKFVIQLEIIGTEKCIPDGILYINGIPFVVFEFKSIIREEATIFGAFKQLTIRYRRDIPELFNLI